MLASLSYLTEKKRKRFYHKLYLLLAITFIAYKGDVEKEGVEREIYSAGKKRNPCPVFYRYAFSMNFSKPSSTLFIIFNNYEHISKSSGKMELKDNVHFLWLYTFTITLMSS